MAAIGKYFFAFCGALCLIVVLTLIFTEKHTKGSEFVTNDYVGAFYVSEHMVSHGAARDLYPPSNSTGFWDTNYQKYAERLLDSNQRVLYPFAYPPAVPLLTAFFSALDPATALKCWRCTSVVGLLIASIFFCRTQEVHEKFPIVFCSSFLLFPILAIFVAGQISLLVGFLPLTIGYYFWQRNRPIICGICWSILSFKPQLMIPVFLILTALLVRWLIQKSDSDRKELFLIGGSLVACGAAMNLAAFLIVGIDLIPNWVHAVVMTSAIFGRPDLGFWQYHMYISLPALLILSLFKSVGESTHALGNAVGFAVIVPTVMALANFFKLPLEESEQRDLMMIVAVSALVGIAPHLLLYDSCMFLLPAWIIFFRWNDQSPLRKPALLMARCVWLAFNVYLLSLTAPGSSFLLVRPTILLLVIFSTVGYLVFKAFALNSKSLTQAPESAP